MVAPIPASLLTCQDAPEVPDKTATQKSVSVFVATLWRAWDDCSKNLGAVSGLLTQENKEVNSK